MGSVDSTWTPHWCQSFRLTGIGITGWGPKLPSVITDCPSPAHDHGQWSKIISQNKNSPWNFKKLIQIGLSLQRLINIVFDASFQRCKVYLSDLWYLFRYSMWMIMPGPTQVQAKKLTPDQALVATAGSGERVTCNSQEQVGVGVSVSLS